MEKSRIEMSQVHKAILGKDHKTELIALYVGMSVPAVVKRVLHTRGHSALNYVRLRYVHSGQGAQVETSRGPHQIVSFSDPVVLHNWPAPGVSCLFKGKRTAKETSVRRFIP